jgi:hypothetical protein
MGEKTSRGAKVLIQILGIALIGAGIMLALIAIFIYFVMEEKI